MFFDSNTAAICSKELRRYFASPIGYSLLAGSSLLFGLGVYARDPNVLIGPVLLLTGFSPSAEFRGHTRLTLLAGLARIVTMYLIPMIAMRLFVEERRGKTIEMLFTSPVREIEIVVGKWIAALLLYIAILAVSVVALGVFRGPDLDWSTIVAAYTALLLQGAGLLAIGEYMSTLTRHESAAAFGTLVVCSLVLRYYGTGVLAGPEYVVCAALAIAGWLLTWRSVRTLRWAY